MSLNVDLVCKAHGVEAAIMNGSVLQISLPSPYYYDNDSLSPRSDFIFFSSGISILRINDIIVLNVNSFAMKVVLNLFCLLVYYCK